MTLDSKDKELLNAIQADFPLVERPFETLGKKLGIPEAEVISRVQRLKAQHVVRMVGGVFNAACLGYRSTLVAMHIPDGRLPQAAEAVSRQPAVSHNYAREHHYNLWFTLTLPAGEDLDRAVAKLAEEAGSRDFLNLPADRLFKIDVFFDMLGQPDEPERNRPVPVAASGALSEHDRLVVKGLQQDLPLVVKPFARVAEGLGLKQADFLKTARGLLDRGVMRRYGASLRHREAGFSANAMSCWKVSSEDAERVGGIMAGFPSVTHCYQRRTYGERWPYSLYGMIHSQTAEGCEKVAREIATKTGIDDYMLLYSTKEFKKQRMRYFAD